MMIRSALILVVLMAGGVPMATADVVVPRGIEPALRGSVTRMDDAGLTFRSDVGGMHVLPWDRVRHVEMDLPDPRLSARLAVAEDLWRARSRLERHDAALAEPLMERLFDRYAGQTSETAWLVAEGLLRCRLARGAQAEAIIPALETARLRRSGITPTAYTALAPVLDDATALVPALPPVWIDEAGLERLDRALETYDAQGDEVVASLARLYRRAGRRERGLDDGPTGDRPPRHPGVEFLDALLACDDEDPERREAARAGMARRIRDLPPWCEAWSRFVVGRSMLREEGVGRQERGMVDLAHVCARFDREQPYLAGLAVAYLAQGLRRQGDDEAAARLRGEVDRRYPRHPLRLRRGGDLP